MNICIIGASGHYNYAMKEIRDNQNLKLSGIAPGSAHEDMSRIRHQLAEVKKTPTYYQSYLDMLDKEKPDIAIINAHFIDNATIVLAALARDIHVFAEKPLATNLTDLVHIKKSLSHSKATLTTMLGLRYVPHFYTAWQLTRQDVIGQIRLMHAQKSYRLGNRADFFKKRETYGGTIPWVGIHAIDWLYWFGQAKFESIYAMQSTSANRSHGDLEMTAVCSFGMARDIAATASLDYLRPEKATSHGDDRIRVAGTQGVVEVRDGQVFLINERSDGTQPAALLTPPDLFAEFCNQIEGRGVCGLSAEDAIYVTEISLLARQAADEKQLINLKVV